MQKDLEISAKLPIFATRLYSWLPSSFINNFKCKSMKTKNTLPQVKIAVLVVDGIFIKQLIFVYHVVRTIIGPKVISYLMHIPKTRTK